MFNSLPAQTSYFSISTFLDKNIMVKTNIALDIIRQYLEDQEKIGANVRIFSLDGYGERLSFRELCLGMWLTFDCIYGIANQPYGYPPDMEFVGGEGIIGWNRKVTNPTIDIPKALKIYEQISASASSYRDKFTRIDAMKKLFYRTDTSNRFFTDESQTYQILADENEEFYNFICNKILEFIKLAQNESKSVELPSRLKFLFDVKPYSKVYDSEPDNMPYMNGLLNLNSVIIQANKFYLSFLTSFEQIIYQYTKQFFPLKLYGTIAYLFNSYLKLIVNYMKPYHAKMLENFPLLQFGNDLFESVVVGDVLRVNSVLQIYNDIVKWRFDNRYEPRPDTYDKIDKISDFIQMLLTTKIEDKERTNHRIDNDIIYVDSSDNHIYEDFSIKIDNKVNNFKLSNARIPGYLYPSIMQSSNDIEALLEFDIDLNTIRNKSDRGLIFITDNYVPKDGYRISNIVMNREQNLVVNNDVKIGILTSDVSTVYLYKNGKWVPKVKPVVNDIYNNNVMPDNDLAVEFKDYNSNSEFISGMGDLAFRSGYWNFIKFILYIPAGETAYLPMVDYEYRFKFV